MSCLSLQGCFSAKSRFAWSNASITTQKQRQTDIYVEVKGCCVLFMSQDGAVLLMLVILERYVKSCANDIVIFAVCDYFFSTAIKLFCVVDEWLSSGQHKNNYFSKVKTGCLCNHVVAYLEQHSVSVTCIEIFQHVFCFFFQRYLTIIWVSIKLNLINVEWKIKACLSFGCCSRFDMNSWHFNYLSSVWVSCHRQFPGCLGVLFLQIDVHFKKL